jgi:hypothetical protein
MTEEGEVEIDTTGDSTVTQIEPGDSATDD